MWPWEKGLIFDSLMDRERLLTPGERVATASRFAWLAEDEPTWRWPPRSLGRVAS